MRLHVALVSLWAAGSLAQLGGSAGGGVQKYLETDGTGGSGPYKVRSLLNLSSRFEWLDSGLT
jgi:hypothetical protein